MGSISPNIFPQLVDTSIANVSNPQRFGNFGTPVAQNLTSKEINFLYNQQRGSYATLASLPLEQQEALAAEAKTRKVRDPGDLVWSAEKEALRQSGFYQQFKQVWGGLSSKELYQHALNQNPFMPQHVKDAFFLAAERKTMIARRNRSNFNNLMATLRQPDETAEQLAREVEQQAIRIQRQAAGLDEE